MPKFTMAARSTLSRRSFLQASALAAAAMASPGAIASARSSLRTMSDYAELAGSVSPDVVDVGIVELQARMAAGTLNAQDLVRKYIARVEALDQSGPTLRSVLELNPDALAIAQALDAERASGNVRGPLHGIPILLKDNVDTADKMLTTAGSLALVGSRPAQDATVAARLRNAGAIILGKANLSEWANFRGFGSTSGWSGRGRQCGNPYAIDRNPCGSSAGSAAAVSASFAAASLGTETDGSIVCPSSACGVVGIKPTVGLTSRAGVIPIASSQDTVGPHGRTVADAAAVLGALVGVDSRDAATGESEGKFYSDYTQFLDAGALAGARIGVVTSEFGASPEADAIAYAAIGIMQSAGATIVNPANYPSAQEYQESSAEFTVLLYEFKAEINAYLQTRIANDAFPNGPRPGSLADLIAFNQAASQDELLYFGQEIFELAEATPGLDDPVYLEARAEARRIGREEGIDAVMDQYNLDALIAPTGSPAWPTNLIDGDAFLFGSSGHAAVAGYPLISVPAGSSFGLPVGITFVGRQWSEPTLIKLAYAFEQLTRARQTPQFLNSLNLQSVQTGTAKYCGCGTL